MLLYSYHLGCPVWASPHWAGTLYTRKATRADFLPQYSQVFNTVEVSSTFYAIPPVETVRRWGDEVHPGFRFCMKFPRVISHDKRLISVGSETLAFLELVKVLHDADCLGPSFLQLGPNFSARDFPRLQKFLEQLPDAYPFAVEVRHADYFDQGKTEAALNDLLRHLGMDRVLLDSRPLFSAPPITEADKGAQGQKPRVPVRFDATGNRPLVRLIGRDDIDSLTPWVEEWSTIVADWIGQGKTPFVFTHTPNDRFAPAFGRMFHEALRQKVATVCEMLPWPGETEPAPIKQKRLFGNE
jgi:uncharacterized protein YecE (DUF72 family)